MINIVAILVFLAIFILTIIFSNRFRAAVFAALDVVGAVAGGIVPAIGTGIGATFTVVGNVLAGAWNAARFTAIALLVLWGVNFLTFAIIGICIHSVWSGLFLGILIPAWSVLYILRGIPVIGRIARVPWIMACIIVLIALPNFLLGIWSPAVKGGVNHWAYENKLVVARLFHKGACERKMTGAIVEVKEDTVVYNHSGRATGKAERGRSVKIISYQDDSSVPEGSEAMAEVMLPNQFGDYVGGYIVLIPFKKLNVDA